MGFCRRLQVSHQARGEAGAEGQPRSREGEYQMVHEILQPLFLQELHETFAEHNDRDLADYYTDQLGERPS